MKHAITTVQLPYSKSIRNRELILRYLGGNLSAASPIEEEAEDSHLLYDLLQQLASGGNPYYDCGNAGTVARFLLALLSTEAGTHFLTGCKRMKERPMQSLIQNLRLLGAEITCLEQDGYLPVRIEGKQLHGGILPMAHSESSQFVSALMLIASRINGTLQLQLPAQQVSQPYIDLTAAIINRAGGEVQKNGQEYRIAPLPCREIQNVKQERDWTSASYFYGRFVAQQENELHFPDLHLNSLQGDMVLSDIFALLGVKTIDTPEGIYLQQAPLLCQHFTCDFTAIPDLFPTFAVLLSLLHLPATLTGIETLMYKESDRLQTVAAGLQLLGYRVHFDTAMTLLPSFPDPNRPVIIDTQNDHRMAMAFAMAQQRHGNMQLQNKDCVRKSFPRFWEYF